MYHCKLHIVLIFRNPLLENVIRSARPFERFEHVIFCRGEDGEIPERGDAVFIDASSGSPLAWRRQYGEGARIILCADAKETAALSEGEMQALTEIWETPLEPRLAAFRFNRLLSSIKSHKDYLLTQTYLNTAIDNIQDMIWFKDKNGLHLKVNKEFCRIVGKAREDVTGKDHCYIWDVSREEFERGEFVCKDTDDYVLRTGESCESDERVLSQHGMRQFKTYKSPLIDENGSIMGTLGIAHDVTDLENMGTEMKIVLSSMPYAILIRNDEGSIINVNPRFEQYFCVDLDDMLGLDYPEWINTVFEDGNRVNGEGYIEAKVRASGLILEIREETIYDMFGNVVGELSIYRDVTLERELEEQIIRNSNTDFMTGLYNRRCFYQYIHKNHNGRPISLMYVDLDKFKLVNDTYGHRVGDEALILTAKLLQESFGREFIARFGGDEFLIAILGPCEKSELIQRADCLLRRMQEVFAESTQLRILSASIGIAQSTDPGVNIDTLIQQSDAALYHAKQHGRARCCVYQDMGEK